jgi:hypothetical protein
MDFCNYTVHSLAEYYLKLFKNKLPSAFLRLVAAIIVWPPIPKSVKKLGFQKKKPFPAGKRNLPLPKLRQGWSLSGKLYPIRAGFQTMTIMQLSRQVPVLKR